MQRQEKSRVIISTSSGQQGRGVHSFRGVPPTRSREGWVAASVIAASALATFLALFVTSRPYEPMSSTFNAQQTVPSGPLTMQTSPSPTPTVAATQATPTQPSEAGGEAASPTPDDAAIQAQIEKALRSDATLAELDVSTIVEAGRVTIIGSVRSAELKQRVERTIRGIPGVTAIDNQLVVIEATPQ